MFGIDGHMFIVVGSLVAGIACAIQFFIDMWRE